MIRSARTALAVAAALLIATTTGMSPAAAAVRPVPIGPNATWLQTVNYYRAMAGVRPVVEVRAWSVGALNHSKYMSWNDIAHDEIPGNRFYTATGDAAGNSGNVAVSGATSSTQRQWVERWMTAPFHTIGILRHNLVKSGFGAYKTTNRSATWAGAATLDVIRGMGSRPRPATPILWPGKGTTSPLRSYDGSEYPDPLAPCRGWTAPTSAPIVVMLPKPASGVSVRLSGPSGPLKQLCIVSRTNTSGLAKQILSGDNAVVIFARKPFATGAYKASITSGGATTNWTFSIDPKVAKG